MNNYNLRQLKKDRKHYKKMPKNQVTMAILKKINEAIKLLKNNFSASKNG